MIVVVPQNQIRVKCPRADSISIMNQPWRLSEGFQVEDPLIFVPWGITPVELKCLLTAKNAGGLLKRTGDDYTLACIALNGLKVRLGLRFRNRREFLGLTLREGRLRELHLFQDAAHDLRQSYDLFQQHLEQVFGKPTTIEDGSHDKSLPSRSWQIGSVRVDHSVFERFVPEEHVRIVHHGRLPGAVHNTKCSI